MKQLIVLIDFSPYTPILLRLAFEWKKTYGFSLTFVYKVAGLAPTLSNAPGKEEIIDFEKKEAKTKFSEQATKLGVSEDEASFLAISDPLIRFLQEKTSPEDLLLLGLKGTGFLKKLLVGSTATDIINRLDRLIIALPKSIEQTIPKKLVLACHVKYPFNEQALSLLLQTIGSTLTEIELLTILSDPSERQATEEYLNDLQKKLGADYSCSISLYEHVDAFDTIKNRLRGFPDDYIVLQKGSRTLNDQLFRKFFISDLVHEGETPLMVLPCEEP